MMEFDIDFPLANGEAEVERSFGDERKGG